MQEYFEDANLLLKMNEEYRSLGINLKGGEEDLFFISDRLQLIKQMEIMQINILKKIELQPICKHHKTDVMQLLQLKSCSIKFEEIKHCEIKESTFLELSRKMLDIQEQILAEMSAVNFINTSDINKKMFDEILALQIMQKMVLFYLLEYGDFRFKHY